MKEIFNLILYFYKLVTIRTILISRKCLSGQKKKSSIRKRAEKNRFHVVKEKVTIAIVSVNVCCAAREILPRKHWKKKSSF